MRSSAISLHVQRFSTIQRVRPPRGRSYGLLAHRVSRDLRLWLYLGGGSGGGGWAVPRPPLNNTRDPRSTPRPSHGTSGIVVSGPAMAFAVPLQTDGLCPMITRPCHALTLHLERDEPAPGHGLRDGTLMVPRDAWSEAETSLPTVARPSRSRSSTTRILRAITLHGLGLPHP